MPRELQVADHARVEQRHCVGSHGIAETGMELLGYRGTADHVTPFEHAHAQARPRQIGSTSEAVVAPANDQRIAVGHGSMKYARGLPPRRRIWPTAREVARFARF